ncbi:MAG: histidine triad nucleotide-binding protein [Limnobacter sp.]|nr:histidine triad nucleotide-binding protein [Limnobacter sp.]
MSDCIFCKIIAGQIPCKKVYEDDDILAFHDINPAAPVHFLIIPKKHIPTLADATVEDTAVLGKMMVMAGQLAKQEGCADGFRTIINNGRVGCQEVYHVHMHVLGGDEPLGPLLTRKH